MSGPATINGKLQQIEGALKAKLDVLTVYELRAVYYLLRTIQESGMEIGVRHRVMDSIEALIGSVSVEECFGLYPALMRQLAERDPDLVARQAIQEAYSPDENTEGRV